MHQVFYKLKLTQKLTEAVFYMEKGLKLSFTTESISKLEEINHPIW